MFPAFTAKTKECSHCSREFVPARPLQNVCSPRCASRLVKARSDAKKAKDRDELKARKEAAKTIGELIEEAQKWFNLFIRLRDADKPCFDCGKHYEPNKPGGSMDAGHLRSRGAATHLRFVETNCFGQRKNCNRPGGATEEAKKAGAAERVGWDVVNALYADNRVHKWQRDELIAIREKYKAAVRELKALRSEE
jgi:hypothetical protein